jgi:hypothetical protein
MQKLIQILIVCGLVVVMGGTASGETQQEIISNMCSKGSYPIEKNMIKVKGFYIGMSICDANKIITEGKYKNLFKNIIYIELKEGEKLGGFRSHFRKAILGCKSSYNTTPELDNTKLRIGLNGLPEYLHKHRNVTFTCGNTNEIELQISADNDGRVLHINFNQSLVSKLFKSDGLTYKQFIDTFTKAYIKKAGVLSTGNTGKWEVNGKRSRSNYHDSTAGFSIYIDKYYYEPKGEYFDRAGQIGIHKQAKVSQSFD